MAYPGSKWGTWFKGRDPNPPVEPTVLLMGCRAWDRESESKGLSRACPCGGGIRDDHDGHCCLGCLAVSRNNQRILAAALQDTDPGVGEERAVAREEHQARVAARVESIVQALRWEARMQKRALYPRVTPLTRIA